MGIRFSCPNGHKLNVKTFLAGKRGVCPQCGAIFVVPATEGPTNGESVQPAGVTQSQSVEAMAPTAPPLTTAVASPSVIISVTDSSITAPQLSPSPIEPPQSIVAPSPQPAAKATPVVSIAPSPTAAERNRRRRNQIILSLTLFVTVIVLAVVLVIVMKRHLSDANAAPAEKPAAPTAAH